MKAKKLKKFLDKYLVSLTKGRDGNNVTGLFLNDFGGLASVTGRDVQDVVETILDRNKGDYYDWHGLTAEDFPDIPYA